MRTNEQTRRRRRGTARGIAAVTAVTAGHGCHCRPRPTGGTEGRDGGGGGCRERSTRERYCRTTHTGERTSERTDRTAGSAGDTVPPPPGQIAARARSHRDGGHGKHCPSQRSRPPKAERSSAGSRPRRHSDQGAHASQGSLPLVALPLPSTPSNGSHGASQRARTVTECTVGAMGSVAAGCEGTCSVTC